jgi:hypothetical protein
MLSRRTLEVTTAALTGTFGAAVVVSSIDSGVTWSRAGVGPGTFPLLAGILIVAASLFNLMSGALRAGMPMLGSRELRKLASLFLPAAAFVAAIPLLGLHVAAAAYVFGALALQRRLPVVRSLLAALGAAAALYGTFDVLFQLSLPRGALGGFLGF